MSLNKFMHPRNKYRKPPDFKALAAKYPEFKKHVIRGASGKVSLDFKNPKSLQALTTTLLKEDFELDVEIPVDPNIPTIPLYMNYLLWIEDLVAANPTSDVVRGLDIGCAASCVYPLMAARQFHWHILATEVDTDNAFLASNNVRRNKLNDKITVRTVEKGTMLQGVVEPDTVYDFSMCNTLRYPSGGGDGELATLLTALVRDSLVLKDQVRVYTVKVSDKTVVDTVISILEKAGVTRVSTHQFCQGRTVRWGVAWTLGFAELPLASQSLKQNIPFSKTVQGDLSDIVERLLQLMAELQITHTIFKRDKELCTMEVTAMKNTWSVVEKNTNQTSTSSDSDEKVKQSPECKDKAQSADAINKNESQKDTNKNIEDDQKVLRTEESAQLQIENGVGEKSAAEGGVNEVRKVGNKYGSVENLNATNTDSPDTKRHKLKEGSVEVNIGPQRGPVLIASLVVKKSCQGSVVEVRWLRGPGGRNSAQQLLLHLASSLTQLV